MAEEAQIEMIPITGSSNIAGAGYDPETRELRIAFAKSGATYAYQEVPEEVFQDLMAAPSKGSYFDSVIKNGGFAYRRL